MSQSREKSPSESVRDVRRRRRDERARRGAARGGAAPSRCAAEAAAALLRGGEEGVADERARQVAARARGARPTRRPGSRRSRRGPSGRGRPPPLHSGRPRAGRNAARAGAGVADPPGALAAAAARAVNSRSGAPRDATRREPRRPARRRPPGRRGRRAEASRDRPHAPGRARRLGRAARPRCARSPRRSTPGDVDGEPLDPRALLSPLPRAYEWVDGSAYLNHVRLVRRARGAEPPPTLETDPLVYQGGCGVLLAPTEDIPLPDPAWGLDFEGEVCVDPRRRAAAGRAPRTRRATCGSSASRTTSPTATSSRPSWRRASASSSRSRRPRSRRSRSRRTSSGRPGATAASTCASSIRWNGRQVGDLDAGPEMHFSFLDLVAAPREDARLHARARSSAAARSRTPGRGAASPASPSSARRSSSTTARRARRFMLAGRHGRDRDARRRRDGTSSARSRSGW